MRTRITPRTRSATRLSPKPREQSFARLAVTEGVLLLGLITLLCGLAGAFDDGGDALVLVGVALPLIAIGGTGRRTFARRHRPAPARVLSGLAMTWLMLVLVGTAVYLVTGTIDRVDDAFVESAAGFSTTALTTVDPEQLSVPMQLWRAGTQWIGGLVGILAGVVALPIALRGSLAPGDRRDSAERLVPTQIGGRRRVVLIYVALTVGLGVAYALSGIGTLHSVVHALTTISTGGFSSASDSFTGFGTGARTIATVGMVIGGTSYFVIWWIIRGRTKTLLRSTELRLYLAIIGIGAAAVLAGSDGVSLGDALFTSASAASTTGFASVDWTLLDASVLTVLLVIVATGSMDGSAGGGLRVLRARTLFDFAARELRRQLDPNAVVVLKHGKRAVDERALERVTGYQIAHLGICVVAAFLVAATGTQLVDAIFTGISAVSTFGPGLGTGPFGSLDGLDPLARVALVPFMLAGRLSVLPLMLAVAWVFRAERTMTRRIRRVSVRRRG